MKKVVKYTLMALGVIMIIGIIAVATGDKETSPGNVATSATDPAKETKEESKEATWQLVTEFKNNGQKNSSTFTLSGGEVKVEYDYNSGSNDMGMLYAYFLDKGTDLQKEGGLPDITTDQTKDKGESFLQKSAGEYYISVNAMGKYSLRVYEKK